MLVGMDSIRDTTTQQAMSLQTLHNLRDQKELPDEILGTGKVKIQRETPNLSPSRNLMTLTLMAPGVSVQMAEEGFKQAEVQVTCLNCYKGPHYFSKA